MLSVISQVLQDQSMRYKTAIPCCEVGKVGVTEKFFWCVYSATIEHERLNEFSELHKNQTSLTINQLAPEVFIQTTVHGKTMLVNSRAVGVDPHAAYI